MDLQGKRWTGPIGRVVLVAAVLLGLVAGVGASPASATGSIVASTDVETTQAGTPVTVSGSVIPATLTPSVVLQRKVDGKWLDRNTMTVNPATGAFSRQVTPSEPGTYTLRVRSAGGSVVSSEFQLVSTRRPTKLYLQEFPAQVMSGEVLHFQGTVREKDAVPFVVLQLNERGKWIDVRSFTVDPSTGRFTGGIRARLMGNQQYRVRTPSRTKVSNTVYVMVLMPASIQP